MDYELWVGVAKAGIAGRSLSCRSALPGIAGIAAGFRGVAGVFALRMDASAEVHRLGDEAEGWAIQELDHPAHGSTQPRKRPAGHPDQVVWGLAAHGYESCKENQRQRVAVWQTYPTATRDASAFYKN
jgi:hypothetical protein